MKYFFSFVKNSFPDFKSFSIFFFTFKNSLLKYFFLLANNALGRKLFFWARVCLESVKKEFSQTTFWKIQEMKHLFPSVKKKVFQIFFLNEVAKCVTELNTPIINNHYHVNNALHDENKKSNN